LYEGEVTCSAGMHIYLFFSEAGQLHEGECNATSLGSCVHVSMPLGQSHFSPLCHTPLIAQTKKS